jgi:uncharacterized membrane protein YjgN (DUF898 family)
VSDQAAVSIAERLEPIDALETRLVFTGSGSEYFRIWVVNTLLTLATLGIYSAWAKVRKASYFARNTQLLGDGFEFTADPWRVLVGRVLALVVLGFYTFSFDFSLSLGLVATATVVAVAPLLYASALRFRLHNTRWRAIRFAFRGSRRDAYRVVLVVAAVWLSTNVAGALGGELSLNVIAAVSLLLLPWMHHRLKAYQHGYAEFAGHRSRFRPSLGAFYGTYIGAALLMAAAGAAAFLVVFLPPLFGLDLSSGSLSLGIVVGLLTVVLVYLAAWPYIATRIQRTVWTHTTIGPFAFKTSIAFPQVFALITRNTLLLLVTAGLYWPFASIAWARYRIGCMSIASADSADRMLATLDPGSSARTFGEGAVDFFGIDAGW